MRFASMGRKRQEKKEQSGLEEWETPDEAPTDLEVETTADSTELEEAADSTDPQLAALQQEVAEWKDRSFRQAADMENLRHRTRREAEDARKFANERLVSELLPVLDNFQLALDAAHQTDNVEAFRDGIEQIHRLLADILARHGLSRIEALGSAFDPNQHEAIMDAPAEGDQVPGQVLEELRAGYRLHERVIRPTLVKVTS
jgi:molecular chaperone GrpE